MSDNRTTELLRELLDERGVSCQTNYLHTSWRVGSKLYEAMDNLDGTLTVGNLTPEQAIAATLGNERATHGTLTAEQVREAIEANSWAETSTIREFNDSSWQAIADELNARAELTCKFVSNKGSDYPPACSVCGYELGIYDCEWFEDGTYGYDGNYCPNCGCKKVGE